VKKNGKLLEYALKGLKGDREIVMESVKNDARALKYVSEELKKEMVDCWIQSMEKEIKNDK